MKNSRIMLVLVLVLFGFGRANAQLFVNSPAQALFDQASYYLSFYYHGFSSVNPNDPAFVDKYQKQLDVSCFLQRQNCEYAVSVPLIKAMIAEVADEHTYYIPAENAQAFADSISGENTNQETTMGFIPIPFADENGVGLRVYDVLEGSGAASAGLARGDRVTAINQQPFTRDSAAVQKLFKSADASGQLVQLSILRGERFPLELNVQSQILEITNLPYMNIRGGVARIVIPEFVGPNKTAPKLHDLVRRAIERKVSAIVVDLRDDPGGVSTECLAGVGAFIGNHTRLRESRTERTQNIYRDGGVFSRDEKNKETLAYQLENPQNYTGKLAVLVNKNSASCSEYFAADIQYAKRALVIGERTAGLGNTGTLPFNLINGAKISVTLVKSFHLDGTVYLAQVTPNVFIKDDIEEFIYTGHDTMMDRALQELGLASALSSPPVSSSAKRFWFTHPARAISSATNTLLEAAKFGF